MTFTKAKKPRAPHIIVDQIDLILCKHLRDHSPGSWRIILKQTTQMDIVMLSNEKKREIFLKSRTANYQASLRLEGLNPRPVVTEKTTRVQATPSKTKHVR